jgi:ParB-like chromosome segregation protein Spo0J
MAKKSTFAQLTSEDTPQRNRLEVQMLKVSDLQPYTGNARRHSKEQVDALKNSITHFGFTNPVLATPSGQIIAGHGRIQAATELGIELVPVIVLHDLTQAQIRAYTIADNQLPNMASWDFDVLAAEIDALNDADFDLSLLGFSKEELDDMIGSPAIPPEEEEKPEKEPSETCICPKCHHEFVP